MNGRTVGHALAAIAGVIAILLLLGVPAFAMPIHGRVISVPADGTAVIAVDATPGEPGKTQTFHIKGAGISPGDTIDGDFSPSTKILTIAPPDRNTEAVSGSSIALDATVFILGVAILGGILVWIGKRVFLDEKY
jgi:hypothetical protein